MSLEQSTRACLCPDAVRARTQAFENLIHQETIAGVEAMNKSERVRCAVLVLDFLGPQQLWFTTSQELEHGRALLSALAKEILRGDAK